MTSQNRFSRRTWSPASCFSKFRIESANQFLSTVWMGHVVVSPYTSICFCTSLKPVANSCSRASCKHLVIMTKWASCLRYLKAKDKDESLHWIQHFNFRLAVINLCPGVVPSELLLSTHSPTLEGLTAELTFGLWLVAPKMGFEPTGADLTRFETLRLNHLATLPWQSSSIWPVLK